MFIQVIIRADRVSVCVLRNYKVSVGGVAGERGAAWLSAVSPGRRAAQDRHPAGARLALRGPDGLPHLASLPALQSFIRAYTTYPRELKHIFHVRLLHLGHVAKSFGLRDAPQNLGVSAVKKKKATPKR